MKKSAISLLHLGMTFFQLGHGNGITAYKNFSSVKLPPLTKLSTLQHHHCLWCRWYFFKCFFLSLMLIQSLKHQHCLQRYREITITAWRHLHVIKRFEHSKYIQTTVFLSPHECRHCRNYLNLVHIQERSVSGLVWPRWRFSLQQGLYTGFVVAFRTIFHKKNNWTPHYLHQWSPFDSEEISKW